jgi:fructose-bisphosphate aldolase class II
MPKPTNNRAKAIVDAAAAGGWAVPAMCLYNVEGIIASVKAAEAKDSPVILQLFPWAIEYADGLLLHAAAEAAKNAKVPVAVHMDHCQSPEMVKRAADLGGFDGIVSKKFPTTLPSTSSNPPPRWWTCHITKRTRTCS